MICPYNGFKDMDCSQCGARMWVNDPTRCNFSMRVCAIAYNGGSVPAMPAEQVPVETTIPVSTIEAYLQRRMDEWNALGDRKYEPANAWGYNFIRACQDDLEKMKGADFE